MMILQSHLKTRSFLTCCEVVPVGSTGPKSAFGAAARKAKAPTPRVPKTMPGLNGRCPD